MACCQLPEVNAPGEEAVRGWRNNPLGVKMTSGSGSVFNSNAYRRSKWKYCAAVEG